ncbi:uncharacterized protein LODBEIA_P26030 [Lodderomyces beijingensis]|uniref:Uncharacterized protein n=1 Tax=Lodderomyces beijingensis TaxID=1775926 RepID=A0ABP0ZJQ9_9ASCO
MSFEVVLLPRTWFRSSSPTLPQSLENLTKLINKSYDKPRLKYDVIQSPRITSPQNFFKDLAVAPNDDICFFLLLGDRNTFASLVVQAGFKRDFDDTNVATSYSCDIPQQYRHYFDWETLQDAKVTVAQTNWQFSGEMLSRCLGSLAFRSYHGPPVAHVAKRACQLELTAFTSYIKGGAPMFMNFVIDKILTDPVYFPLVSSAQRELAKCDKIVLHGDCIIEHDLLPYYTEVLEFVESDSDQLLVEIDENLYAAAIDVYAKRPFHLAFVYRVIEL